MTHLYVPKSDTLGLFLVELLKKAKDLYPGDLEAQALYVRQAMIAKRNAKSGRRPMNEATS